MLVYKHSSHPLPSPRHAERRSGRSTSELRDALDQPLGETQPLAPEAMQKAKARRRRYARRKHESSLSDDAKASMLWLSVVVSVLIVAFVVGLVLTAG